MAFDVWKDTKRIGKPILKAYVESVHRIRTGSTEGFEESTALAFGLLALV